MPDTIPVTFVSESNGFVWEAEVMSIPQVGDTIYIQPTGVKVGYAPGQSNYDWTVRRVSHILSGNRPRLRGHEIRVIVS